MPTNSWRRLDYGCCRCREHLLTLVRGLQAISPLQLRKDQVASLLFPALIISPLLSLNVHHPPS